MTLELLGGLDAALTMGRTRSKPQGGFSFARIPPGAYRLTSRQPGKAISINYLWIEDGPNHVAVTMADAVPISGTVIDQYRRPVKGAAVAALDHRGAEVDTTTSDEGGHFAFTMLPQGSYEIRAGAQGFQDTAQPGVAAPKEELQLRLTRLFSLRGKVITESGRVPAAVKLRIGGSGIWPFKEISADPQGQFTFSKIPAGVYEVGARSEGSPWLAAEALGGIQVGPKEPEPITLPLLPAHRVKGTVLHGAEPVPEATLILGREALAVLQNKATTDSRGCFAFAPVTSLQQVVSVWAKGYLPLIEKKLQTDKNGELTLHLMRGGVLKGQVLNTQGYPVASATIRPMTEESSGSRSASLPGVLGVTSGPVPPIPHSDQSLATPMGFTAPSSATTNGDGRFSLAGLPRGRIRVVVEHRDYSPVRSSAVDLRTARSQTIKVVLTAGTQLAGQVLDTMGRPLSGVTVKLRAEGSSRAEFTGSTGEFRFTGLSGVVTLSAARRGFVTVTRRIVLRGQLFRGVDLVLQEATGSLTGQVLDSRGAPAAGVQIVASQGKHQRRGKSRRDGSFAIDGLGAGAVTLRAVHRDHGEVVKELPPGWMDRVDLQFPALGGVTGTVQDHRTGVQIKTFKVRRSGSAEGRPLRVKRTRQGGFTVSGLSQGSHTLQFEATGYAPSRVKIEVRDPAARGGLPTAEVQVELRRAGVVEGEVSLSSGAPATGARVRCQGVVSITDARGRFTLKSLPEGLHRLQVEHEGRSINSEPVFVRPGETTGAVRILFR